MVDTKAQICLAGSFILEVLGIKVNYLVQSTMRVSAFNSTTIKILGAVIVVISGVNARSG